MTSQETQIQVIKKELSMYQEENRREHSDIKSDIKDVKETTKSISDKLDTALACKADKDDVKRLDDRFWASLAAALTALAGVIFAILKEYIVRR